MKLIRNHLTNNSYNRCWFKEYVYFFSTKIKKHPNKVTLERYVEVHNSKHISQVVPKYQLDAIKSKIQKIYDTKDSV